MTTTTATANQTTDYTLYDLWLVVWRGKWTIILTVAIFTGLAIAYALNATKWFQAHAVMMYAERNAMSGLQSKLGGLAALTNIGNVDAGSSRDEALAVLRSRDFAAQFILANDLLKDFAGFGADDGGADQDAYDMRDAVRFFHENVLKVQDDSKTGRVTLSIFWTDADVAAKWASSVIELINERMRRQALVEAESNVQFLKEQLTANSLVSLQQSISNLLENELQSLMLARGNKEFAFRVIDPAQPPKRRSKPRRTLIVASAVVVGGFLAILLVFLINAFKVRAR
ncbi:MAG: Wzz/FepE/Etk N-terminal domain-containing protein [Gammaproteobacteria bacterium]